MYPHRVYLVQTDTTVGLLSQCKATLNTLKHRNPQQPCLKSVATCKEVLVHARVPKRFKRHIRYRQKTTFLFPNGEAIRLVNKGLHHRFLKYFGWMYSTSANPTGGIYTLEYANSASDVRVEDARGLFESGASKLVRVGKKRARRIR
jgi:tRNA A37 threonylcarbamoyladenosine synthetase subunit TsaC/SUA5/YrdC